jgi:hypothetical protein
VTDQWQVPPGYQGGYQWGMYPPPAPEPVYLVPRPPRPDVVRLALILTYIGVAVATLHFAVDSVLTWQGGDPLAQEGSADATPMVLGFQFGVVFAIVISGLLTWLLPAAGAVVTALLARRGANPARIVLASLMGLFALVGLCRAGAGLVAGAAATSAAAGGWIDAGLSVIEFGLSVTIGVLLLLPATQRYFSPGPGPGRRFVAGD